MVEYFVVIVSARPCVTRNWQIQIPIEAKQTAHDEPSGGEMTPSCNDWRDWAIA